MPNNAPQVAAWLTIPDGCHMTAQLTGDGEVQFGLGEMAGDVNILFEPSALSQFVSLASEVLAQAEPSDEKATIARPANSVA